MKTVHIALCAAMLLGLAACTTGNNNQQNLGPVIVVTAPPNDGLPLLGTLAVTATATDVDGVVFMEAFANAVSLGTAATGALNVNWDTTTVLNGIHTLKVDARDATGNTSSLQFNVVVQN